MTKSDKIWSSFNWIFAGAFAFFVGWAIFDGITSSNSQASNATELKEQSLPAQSSDNVPLSADAKSEVSAGPYQEQSPRYSSGGATQQRILNNISESQEIARCQNVHDMAKSDFDLFRHTKQIEYDNRIDEIDTRYRNGEISWQHQGNLEEEARLDRQAAVENMKAELNAQISSSGCTASYRIL